MPNELKIFQDKAVSVTSRLRAQELEILGRVIERINAGLTLDEILENLYRDFRYLIPYNRIGVSLIEEGEMVRAVWAKSDQGKLKLGIGYQAPLKGSSLSEIVETGKPRVINDLGEYLKNKPNSDSTQKIISEGIRSSLTCPLIANGKPIGFIFFSSKEPNAYRDIHINIFTRIAGQLAVIVEKGWLTSELTRQNHELNRLVELKNKFIGIAAHDIRHPLGYIQLATQLLIDETKNPTGINSVEFLENIHNQAEHATELLDNLLDISSFDAKGSFLEKKSMDVRKLVTDAINHQIQIATVKGTQIKFDAIPARKIFADRKWLLQVMENLISNAIKFSPPKSSIQVFTQMENNHFRFSVQDQGPGVTPEDRENLFQDFARLSARPTGGEKSTGLGLSISRRVVEAHGGTIGVDEAPGGGSIFWFTIPEK